MTRWLADFLLLNERDDELIIKMQTTEDDEVDEWIEKKRKTKKLSKTSEDKKVINAKIHDKKQGEKAKQNK